VEALRTFDDGLIGHYREGRWVPHATLLMPATVSEQGVALSALAADRRPFVFRLSRLGVVRVPEARVIAKVALSG